MRSAARTFVWSLRQGWGWRVAWANFRFDLGYQVGGFTSARR